MVYFENRSGLIELFSDFEFINAMSTDREYRLQAADAEKQARSARNDADREAWLRIAQGWMSILRKRPQSAEEAFEVQSAAKRTQDESDTRQ
jgi:hypothetical protein